MYKLTGATKPCQKGRRTQTHTTPPSDIRRRCWSWQSVNRNDDDMNDDAGGRPSRLRPAGDRVNGLLR